MSGRETLVRGGRAFDPGSGLDAPADVLVRDGRVAAIGRDLPAGAGTRVLDARGCLVLPAFTDLHVHLREPGGEESETVATGTAAALAGGFACIYAMPNTNPTADRPEVIRHVLEAAARAGPCEVVPVSAITEGLRGRALVDFRAQRAAGAGAFSDDGAWVASDDVARGAFRAAGEDGFLVMEHCEDFGVTGPGLLHDAAATRAAGIPGIPRAAEDRATGRDLELAAEHGARLHLCHVSTAGAVERLRAAKAAGLPVSGEVTPHHLVLTVDDAVRGGPDFKMKPPLREASDVDALVAALEDGTLDAIGTDHAPHAEAKKAQGLARAPFGAIGMETAFPVLYTRLVRAGRLSLRRLVDALVQGPARVARREPFALRVGAPARVAVVDVEKTAVVDRGALRSKSRNCPFHGWPLTGWTRFTVVGDAVAYVASG
ncbi:MAG: dihydroorotase [Planctomycetes bacterium]|nr:dihydroorotase [Planctomycetota bacterium]